MYTPAEIVGAPTLFTGTRYEITLNLQNPDTSPFDLSAYTGAATRGLRGQCRDKRKASRIEATWTWVIVGAANLGVIKGTVSPADSAEIRASSVIFDVEGYDTATDEVQCLAYGEIVVLQGVTR